MSLLLLATQCFFALYVASPDVVSIGISTSSYQWSSATDAVDITLWFNFSIYQYTLHPTESGHMYTTTSFTTISTSNCEAFDAKIMIENDDKAVIVVDTISFQTAAGVWYGITGRCADDLLLGAHPWLLYEAYSDWMMDESSCTSDTSNIWMGIDNEAGDCGPYKQIFYFDVLRPNEYITDAAWEDATDVVPQIITCNPSNEPSASPTYNPSSGSTDSTYNPSNGATTSPTYDLTQETLAPTRNPTVNPTQHPSTNATIFETDNPSLQPFINPTNAVVYSTMDPINDPIIDPTTSPTDDPSMIPSMNPTKMDTPPTAAVTDNPPTIPSMNLHIYLTPDPTLSRSPDTIYETNATALDDTQLDQKDAIMYFLILVGLAIAGVVIIAAIVWMVMAMSKAKKAQNNHGHENRNPNEAIAIQVMPQPPMNSAVRVSGEYVVTGDHVTIGGDVFDLSVVDVDRPFATTRATTEQQRNIQAEGSDSDDEILEQLADLDDMETAMRVGE
eukprot:875204_1